MDRRTELSSAMMRKAFSFRTTKETIEYLQANPPFRTFKDVLIALDHEHLSEQGLKNKLVDGLCSHHPEQNRESIDKKVRNWLAGRSQNISRDIVFELCLIMDLSVKDANLLLMRLTDEAIHWRNPEEIIWSYAILHKLSYADTMALMKKAENLEYKKTENLTVHTEIISAAAKESIRASQEELLEFLAEKQDMWGTYHNTAHSLYTQYMLLLEKAELDEDKYNEKKKVFEKEKRRIQEEDENGLNDRIDKLRAELNFERALTNEEILKRYLFAGGVSGDARGNLQKNIKRNWPNVTSMSNMKTRSANTDISRKMLILLFLATDGGAEAERRKRNEDDEDAGFDEEMNDEPETRDQIFKRNRMRLNTMLNRCGFQTLDPRSPFDWLVLYAISVEDVSEIDQKMMDVLTTLFAGEEESGKEN